MTTVVRLTSRAAIGDALELLVVHYRAGDVEAFSIEVSPSGTARVTAVYAPGVEPVHLPGMTAEDDE